MFCLDVRTFMLKHRKPNFINGGRSLQQEWVNLKEF